MYKAVLVACLLFSNFAKASQSECLDKLLDLKENLTYNSAESRIATEKGLSGNIRVLLSGSTYSVIPSGNQQLDFLAISAIRNEIISKRYPTNCSVALDFKLGNI